MRVFTAFTRQRVTDRAVQHRQTMRSAPLFLYVALGLELVDLMRIYLVMLE